eukprot:2315305-Rhodomonas_salina.1
MVLTGQRDVPACSAVPARDVASRIILRARYTVSSTDLAYQVHFVQSGGACTGPGAPKRDAFR